MLSCASVLTLYLLLSQIPNTCATPTNQPPRKDDKRIQGSLEAHTKYKADSLDQCSKEEAIALWIAWAALPPWIVEDEDFITMIGKIDRRLTVLKKTKITNLVDKIYLAEKDKFKQRLSMACKVSIGLDIWTKKGLTASFLAVLVIVTLKTIRPNTYS